MHRIFPGEIALHGHASAFERQQFPGRRPALRGQFGGGRFETDQHLVDLLHVIYGDLQHAHAVPGNDCDEAFVLQPDERFPDWCSTHAEAVDEFLFEHLYAGTKFVVENQCANFE